MKTYWKQTHCLWCSNIKKCNSKACVSSPQSVDFLFPTGLSVVIEERQWKEAAGEKGRGTNWAHRCIGEDRSHLKTWIWELPVPVSLCLFQLLMDLGLSLQFLALAALLCSFSKQFCGFHQNQWVNCLSSAHFLAAAISSGLLLVSLWWPHFFPFMLT